MGFSFELARQPLWPSTGSSPFQEWKLENEELFASFHRLDNGFLVTFPGLARFELSADGARVTGFPDPGTSAATLEHLLLNQVKPLALSLQGKNMFHASAVALDTGAVAFAGRSGQGKSTLAASFAASAHGFLTDDGLEVSETPQGFLVHPSHPSIRLWQDSRERLVSHDANVAAPIQYSEKSRVLSDERLPHVDRVLPLRLLYVMANEGVRNIEIEELTPAEALIGLVGHSFLLNIDDRSVMARHFERLSRMVESLPVFRLDYPRRYEQLPQVRAAVISHVSQLGSAHAA